MKEFIFHGGPLKSEFFGGHSFWTTNFRQAADYADKGEMYVIEIEWDGEKLFWETDYLPEGGYCDAEGVMTDADENWNIQTAAINAAVADGATAVACDDGIAVVNVERLSPRRVTLTEAREIWEDAQ